MKGVRKKMINFDDIFNNMAENYIKTFTIINPQYGELCDRGFVERNLSVNFIEGYKAICPNSVAWYEMSVEKSIKKNGHIDAVVVDINNNAIIYIESKRVYDSRKEMGTVNDLRRLVKACENDSTFKICGKRGLVEYIVILADIWEDKNQKRDRLERWKKGNIFPEEFEGTYFVRDINCDAVCKIKGYHLLGFVTKIGDDVQTKIDNE